MRIARMLKALLVAGLMALMATASQAVPITYNFTSGNLEGPALNYSVGGLSLTVTGFLYTAPQTLNSGVLVNQGTTGLGVCGNRPVTSTRSCGQNPLLDGGSAANDDNEVLRFAFSSNVTLQSIRFANNDSNDVFDFFLGDPLTFQSAQLTPVTGDRIFSFAGPFPLGSVFGIGIRGDTDQVRIAGLTVLSQVSVVPLPAGVLLLLSALATFVGLQRLRARRMPATP